MARQFALSWRRSEIEIQANARGRGEAQPAYSEGMFAWGESKRKYAVLSGQWKLIYDTKTESHELYDLGRDPNEQQDLWDQPEHLEKREEPPGQAESTRLSSVAAQWEAAGRFDNAISSFFRAVVLRTGRILS